MLRLLTFGGLRVARDGEATTDLANQRRRLAVLAAVAAAGPAGIVREKLLFLLWPDTDADKGRHALNQIVYNLRRELGASPIDGTAELRLLGDVMTTDLLEFRAAMARGDHAAAAALFTGPFLDGFFVPGAVEFGRWADDERMRTARQATTAMDHLASAAAARQDHAALVQWTGRLVELDPLSSRRALAHMQALAERGDRDAAIAYGRRYDALARADGDDVDPAVAAEVERLRTRITLAQPAASKLQPATSPVAVDVPAAASVEPAQDAVAPDAPGRPELIVAVAAAAARPRAPRRRVVMAAIGAAVLMTVAAFARQSTSRPALPLDVGDRLLLADVQMPLADSATARAIAFALQSALQQSSRVRFVSPAAVTDALQRMGHASQGAPLPDSTALEVAEREGARYVVSLAVARVGTRETLTLRVFEPATRTPLRSYSTVAAGDEVLPALDELTARLRRDLGDSRDDVAAAIPLPRATTPSLEALRLLAGARRAFNRALYQDAWTLYSSAIALDSGFAAAYAGLASVHYQLNDLAEADSQMGRALALSDRLPPRERLMIEADGARGRGDWSRAATLHHAYLIRYPEDYDSYASLGYDLMKLGNTAEAISAYDSVRAHRRLNAGDLINIAVLYGRVNDYAAARKAQAEALHLDTAFLVRNIQNEEFGATFLRLGFVDSARAVFSVMLARDPSDQARGHRSLAYADLFEGRYASAVQHLRVAIEIGAPLASSQLGLIRDQALLGNVYITLGQSDAALTILQTAGRHALAGPFDPALLLWTGKPLARLGDLTLAGRLLDSARARARPTDRRQQSAVAGLEAEVMIARGRIDDGVAAARRAIAIDSVGYLVETLASALERAGRLEEARAVFREMAAGQLAAIGKEGQQFARLAPMAVARIDAQLGNSAASRRGISELRTQMPHADPGLFAFTIASPEIAVRSRR